MPKPCARNYTPSRNELTFSKGKKELLPGIWSIPAPGHTPGHIGLLFESQGQTLLDLSDTLHTRVQFTHPDWSPRFDTDGKKAAQTRKEMLTIAAEENHLTLFYHLAHPGLGTIQQKGEGFKWQPREGKD
jgi:glyoxylase-like metal-dependent hydrolase (beta-lactamase superfamily II)